MDRPTATRLLRTAGDELARATERMRIPGHPRPYYLSYLLRDEERWRISAKYGSLYHDTHDRVRNALVDVRVGSYRADHLREGGLEDGDKDAESYGYVEMPYGANMDGLRHGLWRLTDARYREAVESWLEKRSRELSYKDPNRHLQAFERREAVADIAWKPFPEIDREAWRGWVERTSAVIRRFPDIRDGFVEFQAEHTSRVFVNSEGSRIVHCEPLWAIECYLWLLSETGDAFPWTIKHLVTDPAELPDEASFKRQIRETVAKLRRLAVAKTVRSFSGPVLLEPVPAGLLMHEAVGHRLEGSRLLASGEGQTFKDSVGELILPEFLSVRDDPTLGRFEGRSLVGHYCYDDEGVPAQDTRLVERGRLTGFLTTRVGVGPRHRSNGHARSFYHQQAISRMGTLIVEAEGGLDDRELRRRFVEEIRRSRAPFGIRVIEATSGETATDAYNFQAFLGEANLAARVYPDGREEWIRGVNFVGTPLNAVRNIIAAGRRHEVDNSFCGAESGDIPVSTISPALLVSELELQSKPDAPHAPFSYPMP